MIRTAWVGLCAAIATLILGPAVLIGAALGARRSFFDGIGRTWSGVIVRTSGVRIVVEGMEHLRRPGPLVVVSNHQSWFDVFSLATIMPKPFRFVAKRELGGIPVFGPAWRAAGHISVDRSDRTGAIRSLEQAARLVRAEGAALVVFPEGTRSPDGRLLPFKKGPFVLAAESGIDIVPVAVCGSRDVFPKGGWRVRPGRIIVRVGPPVPVAGYRDGNRDALILAVRARIEAMLTRPAGTAVTPATEA
jgi:1-acyl-sn-glycerol-3-phosphate acyltransferase